MDQDMCEKWSWSYPRCKKIFNVTNNVSANVRNVIEKERERERERYPWHWNLSETLCNRSLPILTHRIFITSQYTLNVIAFHSLKERKATAEIEPATEAHRGTRKHHRYFVTSRPHVTPQKEWLHGEFCLSFKSFFRRVAQIAFPLCSAVCYWRRLSIVLCSQLTSLRRSILVRRFARFASGLIGYKNELTKTVTF